MSEQKNSKQIPQDVIKTVEMVIRQEVATAEYKESYIENISGRKLNISVFIVNGIYRVSLFKDCTALYSCKTIASYEEERKNFGKRVRTLMDETGVSWELGKLIVSKACNDEAVRRVGQRLKEAREYANREHWKDTLNEMGEWETLRLLLWMNDLHYTFDVRNKKTFNLLKVYLFAN